MSNRFFLPAGNTLLAGSPAGLYPSCSVLGNLTDNCRVDHFRIDRLFRHHTGVGVNLDACTDPVAMLHCINDISEAIDLGHRPRRGAMGTLSPSHPCFDDFIHCKDASAQLRRFNISALLDNDFMHAAVFDPWETAEHAVLWSLAENAWRCADPGVVFIDTARRDSSCAALAQSDPIAATVPCGELPMHANETCNLGSLNLPAYCDPRAGAHGFDTTLFEATIPTALAFLDTAVDAVCYVDPAMAKRSQELRRVGLSVMGWADVVAAQGLGYASSRALDLVDVIGRSLSDTVGIAESVLAHARGAYPLDTSGGHRRNVTATCIPPTNGVTNILGNEGYAIEPKMHEANGVPIDVHVRVVAQWQKYVESAISKTVNLPSNATPQDVYEVIARAWATDSIKGITVYRDGCKQDQPISLLAPRCTTGACSL